MSALAQSNTQTQRKQSTGGVPNSELAPPDPRGTKREREEDEDDDDADDDEGNGKNEKRAGRRKIKIEYIDDKSRRHITFSKRKAGIMKKAYELSTLTGTQVLLLVVSETGLVYTFTTPKLQPLVTKPEGKNLIQACLNAPDSQGADTSSTSRQTQNVANYSGDNAPPVESSNDVYDTPDRKPSSGGQMPQSYLNMSQYPQTYSSMPSGIPMGAAGNISSTYLQTTNQYPQHAQQQYIGGQYQQPNQYMQPNSTYWSQANSNSNGGSKQFTNQSPEKQK